MRKISAEEGEWIATRTEPSPYVSVYLPRRQAEEAVKALRWMAEGRAKSKPLWAAIRNVERALAQNAGMERDAERER